jgi:transposase
MTQELCVVVSDEDRVRLEAIIGDRTRPVKHVQRARIVLLSAERLPVLQVAGRAGVSRPAVWRWQRRYAEAGVAGLLRDKTRAPGKQPVAIETVNKVLALTCGDPPGEMTHWTGRAMANRRPGAAHGRAYLARQPPAAASLAHLQALHRSGSRREGRRYRRSLHASAGPCRGALDRRESQIQALDRTQPGLPIKPGECGTMTHDYKRHGTTTLFAALNTLDGVVHGRCMQRHTHQEFIRFLNTVESAVPAGKLVHAILDNYATHKHPKVNAWLARHPRWVFHFTPTSGSWLNAVESFFSKMTRQRIRRGVFRSIADLQTAMNRYLKQHNDNPKPFVWTKPTDVILVKLDRLPVPSV